MFIYDVLHVHSHLRLHPTLHLLCLRLTESVSPWLFRFEAKKSVQFEMDIVVNFKMLHLSVCALRSSLWIFALGTYLPYHIISSLDVFLKIVYFILTWQSYPEQCSVF